MMAHFSVCVCVCARAGVCVCVCVCVWGVHNASGRHDETERNPSSNPTGLEEAQQ